MVTNAPRIGVVILAGGGVPATLTQYCSHRALLRLNQRYLLEYMLEALHGMSGLVGVVIVAPVETHNELAQLPGIKVAAGETIVENMRRGVEALQTVSPSHCLFITGDIPLVTTEGLDAYVRESIASGAALTYPIIPREDSERRFPGARRTYVRLREGTFTGGNAIFTQAHLLDDKHAIIQELYQARKDPLKLAKILGWQVVCRMLVGTLTLPYLETVAGRILGAPARALVTRHAEIGFDIDKADDLSAVERALPDSNSFNTISMDGAS